MRLHRATKSPISRICEPIWKCKPTNFTLFISSARSITLSMSCMLIPNLFSASPVVILAWVCAPTSGLMRKATRAIFPFAAASSLITSSSGTDSTLKQKCRDLVPGLFHGRFFRLLHTQFWLAGNPALIAAAISPPLTQSAPSPCSRIIAQHLWISISFNCIVHTNLLYLAASVRITFNVSLSRFAS